MWELRWEFRAEMGVGKELQLGLFKPQDRGHPES